MSEPQSILTQISTPPARGATLCSVYLAAPMNFPPSGPPAAPSPIATNTRERGVTAPQLRFSFQPPRLLPQSCRYVKPVPISSCGIADGPFENIATTPASSTSSIKSRQGAVTADDAPDEVPGSS